MVSERPGCGAGADWDEVSRQSKYLPKFSWCATGARDSGAGRRARGGDDERATLTRVPPRLGGRTQADAECRAPRVAGGLVRGQPLFRYLVLLLLVQPGRVMGGDLGGGQRGRVDRGIGDGAVEPEAVWLGGALAVAAPGVEVPGVEVVAADPPVAVVGLGAWWSSWCRSGGRQRRAPSRMARCRSRPRSAIVHRCSGWVSRSSAPICCYGRRTSSWPSFIM